MLTKYYDLFGFKLVSQVLCYTFILVVLNACQAGQTDNKWELQTVEADFGEVQKIVRATGKVIPKDQVVVGAEVSGRITEVLVSVVI